MIKKIVMYQCSYCKKQFVTEDYAIECLNSHDIIFGIETLVGSHDCWGSYTTDWEETGKFFKTYQAAMNYCKTHGDDYRMYIMELVDEDKE